MSNIKDILMEFAFFIKEHDLDELINDEEKLVDDFIKDSEEIHDFCTFKLHLPNDDEYKQISNELNNLFK